MKFLSFSLVGVGLALFLGGCGGDEAPGSPNRDWLAADQAGLSRLYGGIHVRADDFIGRTLGARIGVEAFLKQHQLRVGENRGGRQRRGRDRRGALEH